MASTDDPRRPTAAEALDQLGRLSLREHSMESVLQTVADLASKVIPGNIEASVSLLVYDKPRTPVYSGRLALDLDETQHSRPTTCRWPWSRGP